MKKIIIAVFCIACFVIADAQSNDTRTRPFDDAWRFIKDSTLQADAPGFDDSKWRTVDLPHDWSIEDLPNQATGTVQGPFYKGAAAGWATGFAVGGTGWYRKEFTTSKADEGKLITIHFDGVYMNSDVWINGHHLGNHPYGYTPFYYDLTQYLNPAGQKNVLAVRVKNEGKNSRWYSGSGIYRHVWLTATEKVHIVPFGVYITTPVASAKIALVRIDATIINEQTSYKRLVIATTIFTQEGKSCGFTQEALGLDAGTVRTYREGIRINAPTLWTIETPALYKAVTEITEGGKTIDKVETIFGIRSLSFTADSGFLLNGKKVLLKGGCIHHDNGPLGSATIDRAEERKIEILKKNGYNAIRPSHNPPSKQLLDACDRLGMLVLDEAFDMWEKGKNPQDYHLYFKEWWKKDLDAMILRDRNHPSVIMWSIGNEVNERVDSSGLRIAKQLTTETRLMDPSRPVTEALCGFWDHPGYKWDTTSNAFALLDIGGYNYMLQEYESDHKKFPNRVMVGTESFPMAALENWNMAEKHPYVIGDFVWTAFDYMGEASIGHASTDSARKMKMLLDWPWYDAWCGDFDLIGNKKAQSYYRDVVWRNSPIAMAVHAPIRAGMVENVSMWGWPDEQQSWTWPGAEGKPLQVRVFSRAQTVRLLLNGRMIGEQKIKDGSITAVFEVPYQPGTLKAVNVVNGKETDAITLSTTGEAKRIRLTADRATIHASRNDLCYVAVEVIDDKGQVVPNAELDVKFSISGAGEIAGVGNGNPTDMASFQQPVAKTMHGKCLVIIRPVGKGGTVTLKAASNGLSAASIIVNVK